MEQNHRRTRKKRTEQSRRQVIRLEIDVLNDDVLLKIFDFYVDMSPSCKIGVETWQSLAHVCRRWRSVILGSPRRLNLRLFCTPKTLAKDGLEIWPALPLIVSGDVTSSSPDNVIAALGRSHRVCQANLILATWQSEEVLGAMQVPFPELTDLRLSSKLTVIPDSFLGGSAPRLRIFALDGISFPGLANLLSSADHLVCLDLSNIPVSGNISPEAMVALLSTLSSLRILSLGFQSRPPPLTGRPPPSKRSVIPALTSFHYKGDTSYLEELVTCIYTPQLDEMHITFFIECYFYCPQLAQFIICTPTLSACDEAHVQFDDLTASVRLRYRTPTSASGDLLINFSYLESEWQLFFIEKVCNSSLPPLYMVEDLHIEYRYSEPIWENDFFEIPQWLRLLLPFTAVKNLYLSEEFTAGIAAALRKLVGPRMSQVLPSLQNIFVEGLEPSETFWENIGQFSIKRGLFVHPVAVSDLDKDSKMKSM